MEQPRGHTHVASWGYACFLTVNATSIWGGIFPFIPMEFQTAEITLVFFLTQALSFGGAFIASIFGSYFFPQRTRHMLVFLSTALVFLGSVCLLAAMYLPTTLLLVAGGGVFLGIGCAGMFMLWQRYFASLTQSEGNLRLVVGTVLAPFIYFALYLVPIALTAFLVPLIFVPLCGLCITLSVREMQFDQPMFEDIPRQHPRVYRRVLKDYWRSTLCVGSLAFASGVIRGIALLDEEITMVVNSASMVGAFLSALVLLILWWRMSFRLNLTSVFRITYPTIITGFLLLPFLGPDYLNLFAAFTYLVFSLVQMLMMMQCAQTSRDRGINPVFLYGFFGGIVYIMQSVGFMLGWVSDFVAMNGSEWLFFVALASSYIMGMTLLVISGSLFRSLASTGAQSTSYIEFLPLDGSTASTKNNTALDESSEEELNPEIGSNEGDHTDMPPKKQGRSKTVGLKHHRNRPSASEDAGVIRDKTSKQCLVLQKKYGLSQRETEVMELIARGNSMATIAERLVISENTVRTHAKHIYTKLDIHKRQELLDLLVS